MIEVYITRDEPRQAKSAIDWCIDCIDDDVDSIRAQEARDDIEKMREALEFYAEIAKYHSPFTGGLGEMYFDCGTKAREALGK